MIKANKDYTVEQRTRIGLHLYGDINDATFQFAREVARGEGDDELRLAFYFSIFEKYADLDDAECQSSMHTKGVEILLAEIKAKARKHVVDSIADNPAALTLLANMLLGHTPPAETSGFEMFEARQKRVEAQLKSQRDQFNTQHAPAPEGTVKELAAKYGKSLGEIRKLKAAGLLHTLTEQQA